MRKRWRRLTHLEYLSNLGGLEGEGEGGDQSMGRWGEGELSIYETLLGRRRNPWSIHFVRQNDPLEYYA